MIITADIHLHIFSSFAKSNKTSRLDATLNVLDQIYRYAKKTNDNMIIINGDIYETKNVVEALTNNVFVDWLVKLGKDNINVILNVGNHDISSLGNETITLLYPLSKLSNVEVITEPTILDNSYFNGLCTCAFMPYRRNPDEVRNQLKILKEDIQTETNTRKLLFYHGSILGAKITNREFLDENKAIAVEDLYPDIYDQVFLGHFHKHQKIYDNVRYTGAPLHHTMNDAGDVRGFYQYEPKTGKLKFIKTKYPAFVKIIVENQEDLNIEFNDIDYYTLVVKNDNIDLSLLPFSANIRIQKDIQKDKLHRDIEEISIDSLDKGKILKQYIKNNPDEDLDADKLYSMGMEYLNDAE